MSLIALNAEAQKKKEEPPEAGAPRGEREPDQQPVKEEVRELNLAVGENQTIPATNVDSYSEGVRDVAKVRLTPDAAKFVILGEKPGTTTLLLMMKDKTQIKYAINVFARDMRSVEAELMQLLEGSPGIRVRRIGARLFIEGGVGSEAELKRINQIAELFPGQVESLVVQGGAAAARQINIRVDFFFVQYDSYGSYQFGVSWPGRIGGPGVAQASASYDLLAGAATSAQASVVDQPLPGLDMAARNGWAKVLKHSTVITANGSEAQFSSGGEQNYVVTSGLAAALTPIRFGTDVTVLPRYDPALRELEVKVSAEVMDLTPPVAAGTDLPGRNVSKLSTLVGLKLGQSIVLSGIRTRHAAPHHRRVAAAQRAAVARPIVRQRRRLEGRSRRRDFRRAERDRIDSERRSGNHQRSARPVRRLQRRHGRRERLGKEPGTRTRRAHERRTDETGGARSALTRRSHTRAKLMHVQVLIESKNGERRLESLSVQGALSIGRDADCTLCVPGELVSRRHARIELKSDTLRVEDTSSNGTLAGLAVLRKTATEVPYGTPIVIGQYALYIQPRVNGEAHPAPEPAALQPKAHVTVPGADTSELRREIHRRLLEHLDLASTETARLDDPGFRPKVLVGLRRIVSALEGELPPDLDRDQLIGEMADEVLGLGPLERLLADRAVTEIMVIDANTIYVERNGKIERSAAHFTDEDRVRAVIERIVTPLGRRIDESSPLVDARLPDGSRVNAIIKPLALRGSCITIRKFSRVPLTLDKLFELCSADAGDGTISDAQRRRQEEPRDFGRHRQRQDHVAQRAVGGDSLRRAHRHHRGLRRAATAAAARGFARDSARQHGGQGPVCDPRLGQERAAHAPGSDRGRRMPGRRSARHAAGDEYRPRRLADHDPRQFAGRGARTPRNAGIDGRRGAAVARDSRTDREQRALDRPAVATFRR